MDRYKVVIRTDSTFIIEAESSNEAEKAGLEAIDDKCLLRSDVRTVVDIINLTRNPFSLLGELACRLEAVAFNNQWQCCKFCGGAKSRHSMDCIIEIARYCIKEHERGDDR